MSSRFLLPRALLGGSLLLAVASSGRADDPIDSPMYRRPELPVPTVVKTFPKQLTGPWLQALDRPEVDFRCQAALTVAAAHEQGMAGLAVAVPPLTREVERADQHPTVRLAAAKALVALDAKGADAALF
jgi:hypothetical protein